MAAAKVYLEQALVLRRQALGEAHPETANSLSSLGMLLYVIGDLSATRPYLERALVILEDNLGRNHPNTGTVRRYL